MKLQNVVMEGPIVQIPAEIAHIFGTKEPGTRIYRRDGTEEENSVWFDAVCEVAGYTVSPGGACMYAPVSRAAVHQRIKDGKLTAFLFHVRRKSTNWLGRPREARESAFIYIPVCELKAWAEEIKDRAVKQGRVTREELEGAKPDWEGDFLQWQNEKERTNLLDFMRDTGTTPWELVQLYFGFIPKDYTNEEAIKKNDEEYNRRMDALEKELADERAKEEENDKR